MNDAGLAASKSAAASVVAVTRQIVAARRVLQPQKMLGALGVSGDESPTKADGYCILDDCALDVSSGGGARTAKYALSTSQASGDIAVV